MTTRPTGQVAAAISTATDAQPVRAAPTAHDADATRPSPTQQAATREKRRRAVQPDSISTQLLGVVAGESARVGHALTLQQIADAFARAHPSASASSATISVCLKSLRDQPTGIVAADGGPGLVAWAHRDVPVADAPFAQHADAVLRTLRTLCTSLGRPVTAYELWEQMRRDGTADDPAAVTYALRQLLRSRRRGAKRWREPRVQCCKLPADIGAKAVAWLPSDMPAPEHSEPPLQSRSGALRRGIATAERLLGRPVTVYELRWWRDTFAGEDLCARALAGTRMTGGVTGVVDRDRFFPEEPGRVRRAANRFTCYGGTVSPRYGTALTDASVRQATLEDAVAMFRVDREIASAAILERTARQLGEPALVSFANLRRLATRCGIIALVGDEELNRAVDGSARTRAELQRWRGMRAPGRSANTTDWERGQRLNRQREDMRALMRLGALAPRHGGAAAISLDQLIGSAALVGPPALTPFLSDVRRVLNRPTANLHPVYAAARRFAPPEVASAGGRVAHTENLLDRPDVLLLLYRCAAIPNQSALLTRAEALLGYVIRDPDLLRKAVGVPRTPVMRRAMLVALGLLGSAPSPADPLAIIVDSTDAAAYALATILADPIGAAPRLRDAQRGQHYSLRTILEDAAVRADMGRVLTAIR